MRLLAFLRRWRNPELTARKYLANTVAELRARRCGELLNESKDQGTRKGDGRPEKQSERPTASQPTLADLGISRQQSFDWQKLAAPKTPWRPD